ncbi:MAG: hypothetical protein WDN49_06980 [Acetobacteraceae bacterium]
MGIMQVLRAIDADADADIPLLEEGAPGGCDQHPIGLNGMPQVQRRGPQGFDGFESRLIERDR